MALACAHSSFVLNFDLQVKTSFTLLFYCVFFLKTRFDEF
uniref:Uncharacterized protein n=1 Tax=Anguilla anguilla TaxID=7936 RepID=A0A0E9VB32_ANGAN